MPPNSPFVISFPTPHQSMLGNLARPLATWLGSTLHWGKGGRVFEPNQTNCPNFFFQDCRCDEMLHYLWRLTIYQTNSHQDLTIYQTNSVFDLLSDPHLSGPVDLDDMQALSDMTILNLTVLIAFWPSMPINWWQFTTLSAIYPW